MRVPRFFPSRRLLPFLMLGVLLLGSFTQLVHADTYVGFGAAQADLGASPCTSGNQDCMPTSAGAPTVGWGEVFQAPFAGQLISAGVYTGTGVPTRVVISSLNTVPVVGTYGSGSLCVGACYQVTGTPSETVLDTEAVAGAVALSFNTVTLALPVTVTSGQWISVQWMAAGTNMVMGACGGVSAGCGSFGSSVACYDVDFATSTPVVGNSYASANTCSAQLNGVLPITTGATFTPGTTASTNPTATQCYGNCGTPAVTLVNTNSTHTVNFNQSITLLYQFQSNLNGFVTNVTTSFAKSYSSSSMLVNIGVYTVATNCLAGQVPFSPQCPGYLRNGLTIGSPPKGKSSLTGIGASIPVSNGQWVALAITANLAGLDINDTNTNVALFQAVGSVPPVLSSTSSFAACACKMGLWAWITGNVVAGSPPPTSITSGCQSFATIDCWMPALVNSFCSTTSAQCQTSSALFWIIFFTVIFEMVLGYGFNKITPNVKFPVGESFIFILLMMTFIMTGLSLLIVWVPIFLFMIGAILFSKHTGRYF